MAKAEADEHARLMAEEAARAQYVRRWALATATTTTTTTAAAIPSPSPSPLTNTPTNHHSQPTSQLPCKYAAA